MFLPVLRVLKARGQIDLQLDFLHPFLLQTAPGLTSPQTSLLDYLYQREILQFSRGYHEPHLGTIPSLMDNLKD